MLEDTDTAKGQLQRVDHLIYVTLKYTRTADVILNTLQRLIDAMDYMFDDVLEVAKRKKKIKEIPRSHVEKLELLETKIFKGEKKMRDISKMYTLLRKLVRGEFSSREEYRKNVTLIVGKQEVNQDRLMDFFNKTKDFYEFVGQYIAKNS